ncbi:MAG: FTR1 family protein [Gemmatimonadota bacterium]
MTKGPVGGLWFRIAGVRPGAAGLGLGLAAVLLGLAACTGGADSERAGENGGGVAAGADASSSATFPDTPPGGLVEWIDDIRTGLAEVPARLRGEPGTVEKEVMGLYLSRQEFIERYYGAGGPRQGGDSLSASVLRAEQAFHDVMRMTVRTAPADSAEVAAGIEELDRRLDRVLREAREAGVPLRPPVRPPDEGASGPGTTSRRGSSRAMRLAGSRAGETPGSALRAALDEIEAGLGRAETDAVNGDLEGAREKTVRLYLDVFERVEADYGMGGPRSSPLLAERVSAAEQAFHGLMRAGNAEFEDLAAALRRSLGGILEEQPVTAVVAARTRSSSGGEASNGRVDAGGASAAPVPAIVGELERAQRAYRAGDAAAALSGVEHAYLEGFELLEPRLPAEQVRRIERLIHLELRPEIAAGSPVARVDATFGSIFRELEQVEATLNGDTTFWFGAFNAFVIIVREGLEAVLLIAAILGYLARASEERKHTRQVYAGVGIGVVASFLTWGIAHLLIPVSGGSRELLEGVTAILAVAVLLYVSHWLFHKTYVQDWKRYLQRSAGRAITTGSALAMAALAFAAVYREGFETVLFYQALLFDAGTGPLLAGFIPGFLLISGVGLLIVRLEVRLPIRKLFGVTNAILLYMAFVFLGKGLYNLQEAGLFAPVPVGGVPDHPVLRQLLGIYPIGQIVLAQLLFLALLLATYLFYRFRMRVAARAPDREPKRASRVPAR